MNRSVRHRLGRLGGAVALAAALASGTLVATSAPADALVFERCLAAIRWSHYTATRMTGSSGSEAAFWYYNWLENEEWMGANC